ncbi:MAG: glycosyl transferase [Solirubrobacterales bacterium]|nr:glycosyl transferase [Solirubrobacterales bacterium]
MGADGKPQVQGGAAAAARELSMTDDTSQLEATAPEIDVSVLVPVYNEERYIERSIQTMRRQRFDGQVELVLADGGSTDATRGILDSLSAQDPRIRVFDNPDRSVSSGLNVALRHARGRWVVRMDAHTEFPDDYIALGVERLQRGDTRWVSGPQVPVGVGRVSRAVSLALASPLGRGGSRKWGEAGAAPGGEWELDSGVFDGVWERATLLEYGGWDERWRVNEDSEMAARFFARGERLVCLAAMAAEYAPRDSFGGLWRQYLAYGEFRTKTAARHPQSLRLSALIPPALVAAAGACVVGWRPVRVAARFGVACYLAALGAAGIRALPKAKVESDALLVAPALATMHLAHGSGMLLGALRHGPPLSALASVARLRALSRATAPPPEPVFAPSLGASGERQTVPPQRLDGRSRVA